MMQSSILKSISTVQRNTCLNYDAYCCLCSKEADASPGTLYSLSAQ